MKKIISLIIIFSFLIFPAQPFAATSGQIRWYSALGLLEANSSTLSDMDESMVKASRDYNEAVKTAANIDTQGRKISIMGMEMYISYDQDISLLMTYQKELLPEQMKFAFEMSRDSRVITKNSLSLALRGLYLGLYNSDNDLRIKQKKLTLAETINKQDIIKLEKGLISELDMEESEYNLLVSRKELEASKRSLDNILRSFNSFVGEDIKTVYTSILYDEKYDAGRLKATDIYIQRALKERLEVVSAEKQLALSEKQREIIERNSTNLNYSDIRKDYDALLDNISIQKLKLEKAKLGIEQEIKNSYLDVVKAENGVKSLSRTYDAQKKKLESMKLRYKQGQISKNIVNQLEIAVEQVALGYRTALFDYNTRLMKLEYSAGIGPAYQEGGL